VQTQYKTVTDPNGNGNVITQTLLVTPSATPQPELTGKAKSNTGAIVGGVVGGLGALAAVVAGVLFLLWRRRKQQRERDGEGGEPDASGVQRYASTMSKSGLLRGEKRPEYPPPIATSFNRRHSRGLDQESISPISASDRRNSSFRIADQRLNPSTIFVFDNTSRASVGSLDDSRDYHRTLNVRTSVPDGTGRID
jgi:cell wall integrity and stress response component